MKMTVKLEDIESLDGQQNRWPNQPARFRPQLATRRNQRLQFGRPRIIDLRGSRVADGDGPRASDRSSPRTSVDYSRSRAAGSKVQNLLQQHPELTTTS